MYFTKASISSHLIEVPPFLYIMERWETDIITEHISIATLGCLMSRKLGVNSHMTSDMGMTRTFHTVNVQTGEGIDFLASIFVPVWKPFQSSGGRNSLNQNIHQIHCFVLMTRVISGTSATQLIEATSTYTCIYRPVEEDIHVPKGDFSSLAPKSWYGKAAPRFRCRNILREITHVTYLIKDEQALGRLEEHQIFWGMQRKVPPLGRSYSCY